MESVLINVFVLLVIYQFKHFLADYPLQDEFMLGKFKDGWDFVPPLLAHVTVHGLFTLAIVLCVNPSLWWLALVDMGVHFVMDRIKAGKKYLGRFKPINAQEYSTLQAVFDNAQTNPHIPEDELWPYMTKAEAKKSLRSNVYFWWSLGLDQMVHHLTHYYIIWMLVIS